MPVNKCTCVHACEQMYQNTCVFLLSILLCQGNDGNQKDESWIKKLIFTCLYYIYMLVLYLHACTIFTCLYYIYMLVLYFFINRSIASGEFPHEWKTALVVPLLKKAGMDVIPKNYRPVSNLQYVSKLTERTVVNQLCLHSECRFPLPPCQSAYRAFYQNCAC